MIQYPVSKLVLSSTICVLFYLVAGDIQGKSYSLIQAEKSQTESLLIQPPTFGIRKHDGLSDGEAVVMCNVYTTLVGRIG